MTPLEIVVQEVAAPVIALILMLILGWLVNELTKVIPVAIEFGEHQVELVRSKMTTEQLTILDMVVARVVQAVQQSAEVGLIVNQAKSKKEVALKMVQDELDKLGIVFDVDTADQAIEAAINQGINHGPAQLTVSELPIATLTPSAILTPSDTSTSTPVVLNSASSSS